MYQEAFWVAVAAAVPVIGLAQVVAMDRSIVARRSSPGDQVGWRQIRTARFRAYWTGGLGVTINAAVMFAALSSLITGRSTLPEVVIAFVVALSLPYTMFIAMFNKMLPDDQPG